MKGNKVLKFILAVLPLAVLVSCQEEIVENDLFEGKWRAESVVLNPDATDCELASYVEFSPYVYDLPQRRMTEFNACDSVSEVSNYTVTGDTLILINSMQVTTRYTIDMVNESKMVYRDKNNRVFSFLKFE